VAWHRYRVGVDALSGHDGARIRLDDMGLAGVEEGSDVVLSKAGDEILAKFADEAVAKVGDDAAGAASAGVDDILSALEPGRSEGVRMVGSADELTATFGHLTRGGEPVVETTYPGSFVRLPDGTTVGMRSISKSTGLPTLDVVRPGFGPMKIHVEK
jgi:hypothetical protein